jgi:hypothetical protein
MAGALSQAIASRKIGDKRISDRLNLNWPSANNKRCSFSVNDT